MFEKRDIILKNYMFEQILHQSPSVKISTCSCTTQWNIIHQMTNISSQYHIDKPIMLLINDTAIMPIVWKYPVSKVIRFSLIACCRHSNILMTLVKNILSVSYIQYMDNLPFCGCVASVKYFDLSYRYKEAEITKYHHIAWNIYN